MFGKATRLLVALLVTTSLWASAQADIGVPQVPDDWLDRTNRMRGDSIRVCVNFESLLAPFERDLWQALANALLLDLDVLEMRGLRAQPVLDYTLSLSDTDLYQLLYNDCQALAGFLLSTSQFPSWLTITRPYVEMGFAVATTSETLTRLGELSPDDRVGTKMGTSADIAFIDQAGSQQGSRRFRRVPYPNNQLLLDRMVAGDLEAVIIWEPGLSTWLSGAGSNSGVRIIAADPVKLPVQRFGIVMLQRDAFLRSALDEAIAALTADGTITRLLEEHGLSGRAAP